MMENVTYRIGYQKDKYWIYAFFPLALSLVFFRIDLRGIIFALVTHLFFIYSVYNAVKTSKYNNLEIGSLKIKNKTLFIHHFAYIKGRKNLEIDFDQIEEIKLLEKYVTRRYSLKKQYFYVVRISYIQKNVIHQIKLKDILDQSAELIYSNLGKYVIDKNDFKE